MGEEKIVIEDAEIVSAVMRGFGKRRSEKKRLSSQKNVKIAQEKNRTAICNCGRLVNHKYSCPIYNREAKQRERERKKEG